MKNEDNGDQLEDSTASIEDELILAQTAYQKLTDQYESHKNEMRTLLCNQQTVLQKAEKDREELDILIGNYENPTLQLKTKREEEELRVAFRKIKDCRKEILDEMDLLRKKTEEVDEVEQKLLEKRRLAGGTYGVLQRRIALQKRLMRLENNHYNVSVSLNTVLAANKDLRQKITNLRCEREMFGKLYGRMESQLEACKKKKANFLRNASTALEQRQDAQRKSQVLRDRNDKEQQTFDTTMRLLDRAMRDDKKLSEFMIVKLNGRVEFKSEEAMKREKAVRAALEADKKTLMQFKESFECIQEVTDEKQVENMIKSFLMKEAENFALFNYITELDGDVESVQDDLKTVKKNIAKVQTQEQEELAEHEKTMVELEKRHETINREANRTGGKLKEVDKALDELKEIIWTTFKENKCSMKTIEDILGLDTDISFSNMIVYLGQIENKVTEMLNILNFISLKKWQSTGEVPIKCDPPKYVPRPVSDVGVVIPTPRDREFDLPETSELVRVRVLSKNELFSLAKLDIDHRTAMMYKFMGHEGSDVGAKKMGNVAGRRGRQSSNTSRPSVKISEKPSDRTLEKDSRLFSDTKSGESVSVAEKSSGRHSEHSEVSVEKA